MHEQPSDAAVSVREWMNFLEPGVNVRDMSYCVSVWLDVPDKFFHELRDSLVIGRRHMRPHNAYAVVAIHARIGANSIHENTVQF